MGSLVLNKILRDDKVNIIVADGLAPQVVGQTMGVTLTLWDNGPSSSTTKNSTGAISMLRNED